jgi:6-phosphogluconate dehydrogenase
VLYTSKIISYTQGFMLLRAAAEEYDWNLEFGNIAEIWRGGGIIRSAFLGNITEAFDKDPDLINLLLNDYFQAEVEAAQPGWR